MSEWKERIWVEGILADRTELWLWRIHSIIHNIRTSKKKCMTWAHLWRGKRINTHRTSTYISFFFLLPLIQFSPLLLVSVRGGHHQRVSAKKEKKKTLLLPRTGSMLMQLKPIWVGKIRNNFVILAKRRHSTKKPSALIISLKGALTIGPVWLCKWLLYFLS